MIKNIIILTVFLFIQQSLNAQIINGVDIGSLSSLPTQTIHPLVACDTIFSFPVSASWPCGLAYDGQYLLTRYTQFYKYDLSGNLIQSYTMPGLGSYGGLDYNGGYIWAVSEQSALLTKFDAVSHVVAAQFNIPTPTPGNADVWGCAYDNGFVWVTDYNDSTLMRLNATTGILVDSFVIHRPILPLKIINNELYGLGNVTTTPTLFHINKINGAILDTMPWCIDYPTGFCKILNHTWSLSSSPLGGGHLKIYELDNLFTGFSEINNENISLVIYPNPGNGIYNFEFKSIHETLIDIRITDALGNVIKHLSSPSIEKLQVDLSDKAKGVYFAKVISGNYCITKKIVVN